MHNLKLNDEQTMIRDTVRKLVQDVIAPRALEHDEHRTFVRPSFDAVAELGLLGVAVAEENGGAGLGMVSLAIALEELGRGCGSTGRLFLAQAGICAKALEGLGAAGDALGAILMGEMLGAYVGPEHGVTAAPHGEGFALAGAADYVTAACEAGVLLVCARVDGAAALFVVEPAAARIDALQPLGYRASAPGRVVLDGVTVGAEASLARGADAEAAFARASLAAAIGGAALAVGSASASVEHARRHAEERIAFGKPLARQQAVGHKLVEGLRRAEAGRQLTYQAAHVADDGEDASAIAAIAQLTAVDAALYAADEAIQIHGGYGYTVEYHVERHYRDAKTLEVLDGGALRARDSLVARLAERA